MQFNSKINRIVKSYPTLDGYSPFIIIGPKNATNFPYADGVVTKEVYNFHDAQIMPDYAIIVNRTGEVTSRWYVEQAEYTSNGQTIITFRRDVLADFKDKVLTATCFIEKATVSDNDPAIYNQEQVTFNMIKKAETLLKDGSQSAWLVGYLSSDDASEKRFTAASSNQIGISVAGIQNWSLYKYVQEDYIGAPKELSYNIKIGSNHVSWMMAYCFNEDGTAPTDTNPPLMGYATLKSGDWGYNRHNAPDPRGYTVFAPNRYGDGDSYSQYQIAGELNRILPQHAAEFNSLFLTQNADLHTEDQEGYLKSIDGVIIYDSTASQAYRINIIQNGSNATERYLPPVDSALYNSIKNTITSNANRVYYRANGQENVDDIYVKYIANTYSITLTAITTQTFNVDITSLRRILNDAPYTMFAIPFNSVTFKYGASTYQSDPGASISIARTISMELMSSGALYDLQLLPYCPRQDLVNSDFIDLRSTVATEAADFELIEDNASEVKSFMLFAKESSFTFDINLPITITEKKVQNQTDSWRLCSPNYNGVFEFNAVKNNGVDYFNVDCTYRPYNPYIHVNPNFKELYGNDYDDARGLICGGDFSMPACTDRWLEYEAQNKNYQQSFDRSIQHLEIEQKYQRINQIANAVVGSGSGALSGNVMLPGGVGAVAGGIASAAVGVADVIMGENLRSEQIRYAKDQFAYNLENIKALPNSLAKISAFNKNNKIFPFLEYYSCTDIEREAFRNILTYDGMTVNRIGRIIDFLSGDGLQYIRARLIRCDIHDDLHIVDVIASEMEKGAYYDTTSD